MMRTSGLAILLACLVSTATLHAQTAGGETKSESPLEPAADSPSASAKRQPQSPSRPEASFSPSEKIRADSAVSFPVDI